MNDSNDCWKLLAEYWRQTMKDLPEKPSIWFCHRTGKDYEDFSPFKGLQAAREFLVIKKNQGESLQPALVFGFQSEEFVRQKANERWPGSAVLLDWPGAEYLRYDVKPDELRDAAKRVVEGASHPLPKGLLPTIKEFLDLLKDIRHWLENRRINVTGALDNFKEALHVSAISPYHLEPQSVFSWDHREMVNRLWGYEPLAAELALEKNGIVQLHEAIKSFEQAWMKLEKARKAFKGRKERVGIKSVVEQLEEVIESVGKAIEIIHLLENKVNHDNNNG